MSSPMLFDTHAHLDADEFRHDLPGLMKDWVGRGLGGVLAVATDLESSLRSIEIAEEFPHVWASAGFHPNYCQDATDLQWQSIRGLLDHPRVVALGETGLDRHWDYCPFERQIGFFTRHIRLSGETGLPFIVHMRDCEAEMMDVLSRTSVQGRHHGIMHSFCGSAATLEKCLNWGMMISFSGMITYPKNGELRELARTVPADRLLIETDAPWLSPHPHRNVRPNTPALVRVTAECLAEVRNENTETVAATTAANARRLFGLETAESPGTGQLAGPDTREDSSP